MFDNAIFRVLGHRGVPLREKENTVASFKRAVSEGADGVELDVRATLDNILVVSHDNSLKRVYGVDMCVENSTYREIRKNAGEIATLEEVFDALGNVYYDIEIKAEKSVGFRRETVSLLAGKLSEEKELSKKVMVSSFNPLAMRLFSSLTDRRYEMGIIYDGPPTALPFFMRHGEGRFFFPCTFLKPKYDIAVREKMKRKGYEVCPWTVDSSESLKEMTALRPPFIITNDTEKIVRILQEQGLR